MAALKDKRPSCEGRPSALLACPSSLALDYKHSSTINDLVKLIVNSMSLCKYSFINILLD